MNEKYLPKEFTPEAKAEIIKRIIKEVKEKDSARVGYHTEKVLNVTQFGVQPNVLSKVEAKIIQDRRYLSRQYIGNPKAIGDYEIYRNPNYSFEWNRELKKSIITILGTLVAGTLLWWLTARRSSEQLKTRIERVEKILSDSTARK